ncbi:MAG: trypsin-like peptidase domain-containing protein [Alphaproteobacteria bacterium]|nr:trypsin-like peptidase domain-containing protein [Alphaproteobacteria bacterium]OJV15710.1 MAG: hypothetical protein BGO27_07320 [Alphaproteobacteria bacterium 33-17]
MKKYTLILLILPFVCFANDPLWDKVRFRDLPQGKYNISSGTGFFVTQNYIATNYHVVENCINYSARGAIPPTPLKLVAYDKFVDLALLKSETSPKKIPFFKGNTKTLQSGSRVYVMGYPLDRGETGLYEVVEVALTKFNYQDARQMIEFSLSSINHGNSGGPLMDGNGRILGMVQGKVTRYLNNVAVDKQGLAIRNEVIEALLNKLRIQYYTFDSNDMYEGITPEVVAKDFVVNIHCIKTSEANNNKIASNLQVE